MYIQVILVALSVQIDVFPERGQQELARGQFRVMFSSKHALTKGIQNGENEGLHQLVRPLRRSYRERTEQLDS